MTELESDALGQGLLYEDFLPLRWRALEEEDAVRALPGMNESNEEVMRFIGVLDEYPSETLDEHSSYTQELMRVETKVNLLLGLVGQLITAHFPLPPSKDIKLSATGVEWVGSDELSVGDCGLIDIYLSDRCPRPLIFPSKVERVERGADGFSVSIQFLGLSDVIKEHLEKIIFRHHRRRVALSRRRVTPEIDELP